MIKKFRKKPVEIEAVQLDLSSYDTVKEALVFVKEISSLDYEPKDATTSERFSDYIYNVLSKGLTIHTLEGEMLASNGDYIIKGINGEFYPCKPDIFAKTYELVE